HMTAKALFVRLEAKPGKENEVAKFLRDGQGLVQQEPATTAWFGIKLGPDHLRDLRCVPRRSRTRRAPVWKSCQGVNGKSTRSPRTGAEDREGRRIGGQIAGLIVLRMLSDLRQAVAICNLHSAIVFPVHSSVKSNIGCFVLWTPRCSSGFRSGTVCPI